MPEEPLAVSSTRLTFSAELQALADKFADKPARLSEVLEATHGRGFALLLVFISLPFVTPIPLPGLSTPFGMAVALIGARLAIGKKPWLPKRLLDRELPSGFLKKVLGAAGRVVRILEIFLTPRLTFVHESLVFQKIAGALILISGLMLLLPLPIPFTNLFPAATVVLLAASSLERDGVVFLIGCAMFALGIGYFVLLSFGGVHAINGLHG
jgi:hypothetical protein